MLLSSPTGDSRLSKSLDDRRGVRQGRRARQTRYRKAKVEKQSQQDHRGWLAPSLESRISNIITWIGRLQETLPYRKYQHGAS